MSEIPLFLYQGGTGLLKSQIFVTSFMNDQKILLLSARAPKMRLKGQETEEMVKT